MEQTDHLTKIFKKFAVQGDYQKICISVQAVLAALDPLIGEHSLNVANYSLLFTAELGFSKTANDTLFLSALLHDIGKVAVPTEILYKPIILEKSEWEEVKKHPVYGEELLRPYETMRDIASVILHHHEFYNGRGYPSGIAGAEIPLYSRIIAITDAYEAMTSWRPFRKGFSHREAIKRIREGKGAQFDPELVELFFAKNLLCRRPVHL